MRANEGERIPLPSCLWTRPSTSLFLFYLLGFYDSKVRNGKMPSGAERKGSEMWKAFNCGHFIHGFPMVISLFPVCLRIHQTQTGERCPQSQLKDLYARTGLYLSRLLIPVSPGIHSLMPLSSPRQQERRGDKKEKGMPTLFISCPSTVCPLDSRE